MIGFLWPAGWLLLLPAAALLYWKPFRQRRLNALRLLLYALLALALSGPVIEWPDRAGTLVVVADRSRSLPEGAEREAESLIRRLQAAMPPGSKLGVVGFGAEAAVEKLPDSPGFDGFKSRIDPDGSNLSGALALAQRLIPADSPGRIWLLSDGVSTGANPARAFAGCAARGVPVDYRYLRRAATHDLAVAGIDSPLSAAAGEFYTLNCRILSPEPQRAVCRIRRGNGPWLTREIDLRRGVNFVSWRDRGLQPGVADYTLEVTGADPGADERPENNRARRLIAISGRKPVLLLSASPSGNLAKVLRNAGIPVELRRPSPAELAAARLAGYSGVILENVPADRLGPDGMALLAELVRSGSLGLMMTGGRSSFAVGGYYRSPLEPLLPVAMEQRQELRKNLLAIMVALDRSGSMAASVGGLTKMDMANLATVEVLKLLMPGDEFGVIAVDSSAHSVIPLTPVEGITGGETRIRAVESMGGGIFTYTALARATQELLASKAATRHLILFADAADAEEPGEYRALLDKTSRAGITVSVVGLGFETDCDAAFLKDVAKRGGGMVYFSDRADELPRIFAQDTFLMARNTFLDTPVEADYTAALRSISKADFGRSTGFGGYNLCYGKEGGEVLLVSRDEFLAPLAAIGRAGLGRVSVLTAEADGAYTGRFAADSGAATLLAALANWMTAPADDPDSGCLVIQSIADGAHRVELLLDPARERDPFPVPPSVRSVSTRDGEPPATRSDAFFWADPDRLEADIPLENGAITLAAVDWPGKRPVPLAPVTPLYSPEFRPADDSPDADLPAMSAITGGRERLLPDNLWDELPSRPRRFDLSPWIALLVAVLLLLEVAERRIGVFPARFRIPSSSSPSSSPSPPSSPPSGESDSLGEAFRRVRRR